MRDENKWGLNWKVWVASRFTCVYCGFDGLSSVLAAHQFTVDHIRPRSRGGTDVAENLAAACNCCNFIKAEWGRSVYDPARFENKSTADVLKAAKTYIETWYGKWDNGYKMMMEEARQ